MKQWYDQLKLPTKIMLIIFVSSLGALSLATVFISIYSATLEKSSILNQTRTAALHVAASSRAALLYRDKDAAERYLESFALNNNILAVGFLYPSGDLLANYQKETDPFPFMRISESPSEKIIEGNLHLIEPIFEGDELLGHIYVVRALDDLAERKTLTLIFMFFITLLCAVVAIVAGSFLLRIVTMPLESLLGTIKLVSANQDYSIRAKKYTSDELGELTDELNWMLEEVRQRTRELHLSEEWFRGIIHNTAEFIFVLNQNFDSIYFNPMLASQLGRSNLGNPVIDYFHEDDVPRLRLALQKAIDNEPETIALEQIRLVTEDRVIPVDWMIKSLLESPGVKGIVLHGRDVTAQLKARSEREALIQQLEAKNKELERFTYTVSHDLKSPLITISGFAGLLRDDIKNGREDRLDKHIDLILTAANTLQRQLQDLLELSRVGRVKGESQVVPLSALIKQAIRFLAGPIENSGVTIEVTDDLPMVLGDPATLYQVFQNLIDNAIKFIGKDNAEPKITITASEADGVAEVVITDNGVGIPSNQLEKIFGLFDRLETEAEGTGIGLALVKRIVELHGGAVVAESEGPGFGSRFVVRLPVGQAKRHEEEPALKTG